MYTESGLCAFRRVPFGRLCGELKLKNIMFMHSFIKYGSLVFLFACARNAEIAKQVELTGMNGPAYYTLVETTETSLAL